MESNPKDLHQDLMSESDGFINIKDNQRKSSGKKDNSLDNSVSIPYVFIPKICDESDQLSELCEEKDPKVYTMLTFKEI